MQKKTGSRESGRKNKQMEEKDMERKNDFETGKNDRNMEKYSVLLTVYAKDYPQYLTQAIDSMLGQTVPCSQFVITVDGPVSSELEDVIKKYDEKYPGLFTVHRLKRNAGLGRALDEGLKQCRHDLIARMDADDISRPERCEKLLKLFQSHAQLSLAGTDIDEFYEKPQNAGLRRAVPGGYADICMFMKRRSPFNHVTVMFRKAEVLRCGGYGRMRRKQDLDLFARMLHHGCYALNINEPLVLVRADKDNYRRRSSWEYCRSYIEVQKMNYKRGYCSLPDLLFVAAGQLTMHFAPKPVMKFLSDSLLRKPVS